MMVFLVVGTLGFVAAEDIAVPEPQRVGFFENQMFNLRTAFTFNKEVKIERVLDMAEKRLAEAELLAEEDPEAYEAAQTRYDDLVAKAEGILADVESEGGVDDLERIARIQNRFEMHNDHVDKIYVRALNRFEMNDASDEKIERFEMFHERALNRSADMEQKAVAKQEMIAEKHKALEGMNDEELGVLLSEIEEGQGLKEAREMRESKVEARNQQVAEIRSRGIDAARVRLIDSSLTGEERVQIKNRIAEETRKVEKLRAYDGYLRDSVKSELNNKNGQ